MTELIDAQPQREGGVIDLAGRFPPGFVFGVASSAYQIEGAVNEDGRGPSIWDAFAHQPGRTANGETGDVACDHYHRWEDDLDLMRGLGVDAYRFSVSWPRVLPEGTGHVNQPGLGFYDRLVDGLLERNIDPVLTLYHWDLPQALQERGGWATPDAAEWFAEYASVLADRLGDRVRTWVTLNEPQVFAFTGHGRGRHAPGIAHWPTALRVADNALAAHASAAARIRSAVPDARIGVALDLNQVEPATDSEADEQAALRHRALQQDWFLDPLFGRGYPEVALQAHAEAGHLEGLALAPPAQGALDFIGLNYYTRELVSADAVAPFGLRVIGAHGVRRTTMGWEIHPDGLRQVLRWLHASYAPRAIVVTENGAAFPDSDPLDGDAVDDAERRAFLADHVAAAAQALAEGVPLTGYFAWSLLDNFEWEKGYGQRFGIVRVDYATLRRSLKASGAWYGSLLAARNGRGSDPPE
jgi:beta-glucosidase